MNYKWPDNKKFAFTIVDDTDNATLPNIRLIYDFLFENKIITTKSVWCYESRGNFKGATLESDDYVNWIKSIQAKGFEISIHNVGDGAFSRKEIINGIDIFKSTIGYYPKIHCNHSGTKDNVYWYDKRFTWPISTIYKIFYFIRKKTLPPVGGEFRNTDYFWGDILKKRIKYVRNLTFSDINTLKCDPKMPWHDPRKHYANYWFSSSDGQNVELFNNLISKKKLDQLESEGGACIVYTHFASGFINEKGEIDPLFKELIVDLASRQGWFVPCGVLLDYILKENPRENVKYYYLFKLNFVWDLDRIKKFLFHRI